MAANKKLLFLPGDGIGPEVMKQVRNIIDWTDKHRHVSFEIKEDLVGGSAYDIHGTSLTDKTLDIAMNVDAVLLGAVGGPKWDNVERDHRPEAGLLKLRKELDLFANLRPATVMPPLAAASSLKTELVSGLDIMIVRESTGGVYFGEPKQIITLENGNKQAVDTQVYTTSEIKRVIKVAFDLASKRGGTLHSVEKANVMETGVLWREIATKVGENYPNIELIHMYADNCAMQLVRQPKQFSTIVTDNLFGDILSDCAAMLTGSLGMLPSATLNHGDKSSSQHAMYEPVHGSAPDIAGLDKANPLATILSYSMMLRYSFDMAEDDALIENAVANALERGYRTEDIIEEGKECISCSRMGEIVIEELNRLAT